MEVLDPEHSGIDLFDEDWKVYSRNSGMTGHKITGNGKVENAMITDGCRISGHVKHSILFAGVTVEDGAEIEDAVVMGGSVIKAGAKVKHCIIAENVTIGENAVVGAMPVGDEKGVATIGSGICIGAGAKIGPKAMINNNVEAGEEHD
jgi:glucose-1-phosphate adenylyltransferase